MGSGCWDSIHSSRRSLSEERALGVEQPAALLAGISVCPRRMCSRHRDSRPHVGLGKQRARFWLATMARSGGNQTHLAWRLERYLTWTGDMDKIVRAYRGAICSQHQGDVALLYRNLTGQGIDVRLTQLTGHPD